MTKALLFIAIAGVSMLAMACLDETTQEQSPTPTRAPVKATATPRPAYGQLLHQYVKAIAIQLIPMYV